MCCNQKLKLWMFCADTFSKQQYKGVYYDKAESASLCCSEGKYHSWVVAQSDTWTGSWAFLLKVWRLVLVRTRIVSVMYMNWTGIYFFTVLKRKKMSRLVLEDIFKFRNNVSFWCLKMRRTVNIQTLSSLWVFILKLSICFFHQLVFFTW